MHCSPAPLDYLHSPCHWQYLLQPERRVGTVENMEHRQQSIGVHLPFWSTARANFTYGLDLYDLEALSARKTKPQNLFPIS